jgi:hypothetical protein
MLKNYDFQAWTNFLEDYKDFCYSPKHGPSLFNILRYKFDIFNCNRLLQLGNSQHTVNLFGLGYGITMIMFKMKEKYFYIKFYNPQSFC